MDKYKKYAAALFAIYQKEPEVFKDPACKVPIKHFIRTASEQSSYHASTHYRSKDVEKALAKVAPEKINRKTKYHKYCSKNFRHEHMVPVEEIYQLLLTKHFKSAKEIELILKSLSKRATITLAEDDKLEKKDMPKKFKWDMDNLDDAHLARYREEGIADNLIPRTDGKLWNEH